MAKSHTYQKCGRFRFVNISLFALFVVLQCTAASYAAGFYWQSDGKFRGGFINESGTLEIFFRNDDFDKADDIFQVEVWRSSDARGQNDFVWWRNGNGSKLRRGHIKHRSDNLDIDLRFDGFDATDEIVSVGSYSTACTARTSVFDGNYVWWRNGSKLRRGSIANGQLETDLRFDGFDLTDRIIAAQSWYKCDTKTLVNRVWWRNGNKLRRGHIENGQLNIDLRFDGFDSSDKILKVSGNTVWWRSGNKYRRGQLNNGDLTIDIRFDGFDSTDRIFSVWGQGSKLWNTVWWRSGNNVRGGKITDRKLDITDKFDGFDSTDRIITVF